MKNGWYPPKAHFFQRAAHRVTAFGFKTRFMACLESEERLIFTWKARFSNNSLPEDYWVIAFGSTTRSRSAVCDIRTGCLSDSESIKAIFSQLSTHPHIPNRRAKARFISMCLILLGQRVSESELFTLISASFYILEGYFQTRIRSLNTARAASRKKVSFLKLAFISLFEV